MKPGRCRVRRQGRAVEVAAGRGEEGGGRQQAV